jgi:glycosyltransferase involved in cell wall biosynthesis
MDVPFIWHGVDSNVFKPMEDNRPKHLEGKFIVGDINRNQPRKQPIRIIEAFSKFAKDKNDVILHMQKDWNDRFGWPLKYFTDLYGVNNKCMRPGKVGMSREEVAKVYNVWDVNLMCTGGEGFGLAFAESMMCGVPNIACDYTTSKELVDDGWPRPRGLLTKYELICDKLDVAAVRRSYVDIDDLADKLNYYYHKRDKLKKHSENSAKWAKKNLNMNTIGNQWLDLVKDVLNEE